MRFGMNMFLWVDTLTDDVLPLLEDIKQMGFDAVEIPLFETDTAKFAAWGKNFDNIGLARTGCVVRGEGDNPISSDPAVRRKGIEANKIALECCQAAGVETLAGPYHSALGYFSGRGPTDDEWKWGVEGMREVAEHAEICGVNLGLEAVNRFECYLLNCAADLARFCNDVNHPRCKAMYDTFHAHIEEKSVPGAIRTLKDHLVHVHISENDRSTPGTGNVRWPENFDTLHEIGYDNLMVVEAFGLSLENLIAATKIWRRMYASEMQLAGDALKFMKEEVAKRWG
ncbi:MAG: sugar phosphate isomerase/epimerase [Thermoguttaceae bacterium]|jgi:D-psicose/D-tagatose/L-ribulose 3-epimerase|nr:sugar phosphate isomerase/epimerase [Thermoguttaceae bacterium]